MPWPAWLCRENGQVCLASALAVCDETSTFAMGAWDKSLRPGVSVVLSAQREATTPTIEPGEPLTFSSSLIKAGATLAWIHLEVRRGSEVIATGRHLKFQPAGLPPGYTILTHPIMRPVLQTAMDYMVERTPDAMAPAELPTGPRREVLSMSPAPADESTSALPSPLLADPIAPTAFSAALDARHGNPGRSLHGGCASMLLEEACSASYCLAHGAAAPPPVQRIQVSLLGAIDLNKPKTVGVNAVMSAREGRAHAVLRRAGVSTPAVEGDVWW